jgi:hypothetical protein
MSGNTMLMRSMQSSKVAPKHKPTKSNWVLRMFKSETELSRHMLPIYVYAYVNMCVCVCVCARARA